MADTPRFGIRFKAPANSEAPAPAPVPASTSVAAAAAAPAARTGQGTAPCPVEHHRVPIYHQALELAAQAHQVIERADGERFFLRDQLDRKSTMIPQLIAQGLATADMPARRALYRQARHALTDCATIFDMMIERGSVARDAIERGRALAHGLLDQLLPLTVDPPKTW